MKPRGSFFGSFFSEKFMRVILIISYKSKIKGFQDAFFYFMHPPEKTLSKKLLFPRGYVIIYRNRHGSELVA